MVFFSTGGVSFCSGVDSARGSCGEPKVTPPSLVYTPPNLTSNWFIDYQCETDSGGAWGGEVAKWLKKAGYTDVQEDWNYKMNKTAANLQRADALYSKNYQVCLLIDADLLSGKTATVSTPNHWVVLASNIRANLALPTSNVTMNVYTWGSLRVFPDRPMQLDDFVDYYYGYVAAKY